MFESLKCARKGHMYVDSRSQPGMQTCVRCRLRQPFEGGVDVGAGRVTPPTAG